MSDPNGMERHYAHLPVEASSLSYPIDFRQARNSSVPLHPASERVYDAASARD